MPKQKIYFEGLNALRFLAAFLVFILHVELFKWHYGYHTTIWSSALPLIGNYGVNIFFSLSGFLITYLLLVELDLTNTINIKHFLFRRFYRIWPLYFFIVLLGFFIIPAIKIIDIPNYSDHLRDSFYTKLILYITFLPNFCLAFFKSVPYAGMSWSVGVEEQFYLLWPFLIKNFKNKIRLITTVFIVCFIIKLFITIILHYSPNNITFVSIKDVIVMTRFECMALGAMGAYLFKINHKIIILLHRKAIFYPILILAIILPFITPKLLEDGFHMVSSFVATIIIITVANSKFKILQHPILDYLGKISYGIYMYHMIAIGLAIYLLKSFSIIVQNTFFWNFSLYLISFVLTIFFASISYEYFESYFIGFKNRYAIILSGESAKTQIISVENLSIKPTKR